jgi:hypothetical protein
MKNPYMAENFGIVKPSNGYTNVLQTKCMGYSFKKLLRAKVVL